MRKHCLMDWNKTFPDRTKKFRFMFLTVVLMRSMITFCRESDPSQLQITIKSTDKKLMPRKNRANWIDSNLIHEIELKVWSFSKDVVRHAIFLPSTRPSLERSLRLITHHQHILSRLKGFTSDWIRLRHISSVVYEEKLRLSHVESHFNFDN